MIGTVMRWTVAKGYRPDKLAGDAITAVLPRNGNATQYHKALPHVEVGTALAKVRNAESHAGVRLALEIMVLTAPPSNEVRGAAWDEIKHDVSDYPRQPHEGEARAPGYPVEPGIGTPRGSPAAPRQGWDRVPRREGRQDPRLDVR